MNQDLFSKYELCYQVKPNIPRSQDEIEEHVDSLIEQRYLDPTMREEAIFAMLTRMKKS